MARPSLASTFRTALIVLGCLPAAGPARADIPDLTWGPVEVVDDSVDTISGPSGISVVFANSAWNVAYEESGVVYLATRDNSGWLPPTALSSGDFLASNPHVAASNGLLHVIWAEFRPPKGEIWTRHRDANGWSNAECLTCDRADSRHPVIAGDDTRVLALWEEGPAGYHEIRGRFFDGSWDSVEIVTASPNEAIEPTVSGLPYAGFYAAWTDTRFSSSSVFRRTWSPDGGGWGTEQRLTDAAHGDGECGRPSIHAEMCCGDVLSPHWFVAFERVYPGETPAISTLESDTNSPTWLSSADPPASYAPNADGFAYIYAFSLGGPVPRYLVTFTRDASEFNPRDHTLALVGGGTVYGATILGEGLSTSAVGATEGNPHARIAAAWIESRAGVPTLVTRLGQLPGATGVDGPRRPEQVELAVRPNPGAGAFAIRLALPERASASLRVVDAAGRSIFDWGAHEFAAGESAIPWDARDARGVKVRPGLYFAVARIGERRLERALVVIH